MNTPSCLASAVALSLAAACVSADRSGKHASPTTNSSSAAFDLQKEEFVRSTEKRIEEIEVKLTSWKAEVRDASGSTKEAREGIILSIENKLEKVRTELNRLKEVSIEGYADSRKSVERTLEDLNEEFQVAMKDFR